MRPSVLIITLPIMAVQAIIADAGKRVPPVDDVLCQCLGPRGQLGPPLLGQHWPLPGDHAEPRGSELHVEHRTGKASALAHCLSANGVCRGRAWELVGGSTVPRPDIPDERRPRRDTYQAVLHPLRFLGNGRDLFPGMVCAAWDLPHRAITHCEVHEGQVYAEEGCRDIIDGHLAWLGCLRIGEAWDLKEVCVEGLHLSSRQAEVPARSHHMVLGAFEDLIQQGPAGDQQVVQHESPLLPRELLY
mmetsp:Transcript_38470/g.108729  ORF Transcript_38470/g.108729 Transcript_38470/m.108729 type:complete len:245 (+) Transcript_38470:721-1455(+)